MKLRRAGRDGVLVELDSAAAAQRLYAALRAQRPPGVAEIVPGACTVLLAGPGARALAHELPHWPLPETADVAEPPVELPVVYDGPDLEAVARLKGLSVERVIELHAGAELRVAFCGFVPGFAYLSGLPPELHVARRATPRTRVDAGAVGLAAEFTGVYPRASPGGWQLIGRTARVLWDESRDPPALLAPGMRVRFVAVSA